MNNMKQTDFYKKCSLMILLWSFVLVLGYYNIGGVVQAHALAQEAFVAKETVSGKSVFGIISNSASKQRVVNVSVMEREYVIDITKEDYENMLRIVEAEAGCEDRTGKILVANVILNRVNDEAFPDTVTEVIFQKEKGRCQFSPVSDGRFYTVQVSEETIEAVNAALYGEDCSEGALYFMARKYADKDRAAWFDRNLTKLFTYGGHEFFC